MKVLFKSADYGAIEEVSVADALWKVQANHCEPSFTQKEKAFLTEHADKPVFSLLDATAARKLAGSYLSDLAVSAITDADDGCVRGFSDSDIEVRRIATDEFVWGASEPKKLASFARNLKRSAKGDAIFLLRNAGLFNNSINAQMLERPVNEVRSASDAFAIMANEPLPTMYAGIYSSFEFGGYMKCWPDENELQKILDNPEEYAVVEVIFK